MLVIWIGNTLSSKRARSFNEQFWAVNDNLCCWIHLFKWWWHSFINRFSTRPTRIASHFGMKKVYPCYKNPWQLRPRQTCSSGQVYFKKSKPKPYKHKEELLFQLQIPFWATFLNLPWNQPVCICITAIINKALGCRHKGIKECFECFVILQPCLKSEKIVIVLKTFNRKRFFFGLFLQQLG